MYWHSSLSYLRRFPFESRKIDRSFVSQVNDNPSDASLVRSIIAMAASLGLKVVAEGIETDRQLEFVKNAGCDIVQGYRLGKPMPASEFVAFIQERTGHLAQGSAHG